MHYWSSQEPKVKEALIKHSAVAAMPYNINDGKVYQLKNLEEFDSAVATAKDKILAICYHNGCREQEAGWD